MIIHRIMVRGLPAPQGSKRPVRLGNSKIGLVESSRAVGPWREAVRAETQRAMPEPLAGAALVRLIFTFTRPKGHYRSGRHADQLRPGAPHWHASRPDLDKLIRAVLDGLTAGGAWKDDGQVCGIEARKVYGAPPGCLIELEEAEML